MTGKSALAYIERHGVVLESARHPAIPNLADKALGTRRRGSWWGDPKGKQFFWLTRQIRANPNVLTCRLVGGHVTYVHRRLWPALVRMASTIGTGRLAWIRERHTAMGAHRVDRIPFGRWVTAEARKRAAALDLSEARSMLSGAIDAIV